MSESCLNQQQGGKCPFSNGDSLDGYRKGIQWIDKVDNFIHRTEVEMTELSQDVKQLQKQIHDLNNNMKFWAGMMASIVTIVGAVAFVMNLIRFNQGG